VALDNAKYKLANGFGLRVVAIGGSVVAGQGVKGVKEKTFTGQLEALLRAKNYAGQIAVHNHGAHGADACKFAPDTKGVILPWLADAEADVLLIELSVNDHREGREGPRTAKCIEAIIHICLQWKPSLAVILVELPCRKCAENIHQNLATVISDGSKQLGRWAAEDSICRSTLPKYSNWSVVFGAAPVHAAVRHCYQNSVSSVSIVEVMSAVMTSLKQNVSVANDNSNVSCHVNDVVDAFGGAFGGLLDFWVDYHFGVHAHRLVAETLVELFTHDVPHSPVAMFPPVPDATTFVSNEELVSEFAPLVLTRGGLLYEFIEDADCGTDVELLKEMALRLYGNLKTVKAINKCRSKGQHGWFAFRGKRVNRFHHFENPSNNYGLIYVGGKWSSQEVSLIIDLRDHGRSIIEQKKGYCGMISYLHSYENFGRFEACAELIGISPSNSSSRNRSYCDYAEWTQLDSYWSTHESVSRAVPFAFLPTPGKVRVRIRLPSPDNPSMQNLMSTGNITHIFITALEVIPALDEGGTLEKSCSGVV